MAVNKFSRDLLKHPEHAARRGFGFPQVSSGWVFFHLVFSCPIVYKVLIEMSK